MLCHTMKYFVDLWSKTNKDKSQILYICETGSKTKYYCLAEYCYRIAYSMHGQPFVTGGQNVHLELD